MAHKKEFILGLIGSCVGLVFSLFITIMPTYAYLFNRTQTHADDFTVLVLILLTGAFLLVVSIIGLVGTFKLKKSNPKKAGILMLISGALQILSFQGIMLTIAGVRVIKNN
ncbi:DUF4064 domain-containing protein [Caldalkalibacillus salinus]|uniref:DUF4064 domain-containing protein n=1 Tax=Caldalkalibacillus salinus TaxID=2803787 RepID=UPI001921DE47|nr:DUF4064 domain-containing protein [Caldalkalibacillus salinus]